jgi:YfiH family protein
MHRKKQGEIEWLEFELLAKIPEVRHAVFLRKGGVSHGPFTSLNLGEGTGDDPEHIRANQEAITKILGVNALVSLVQEHGAKIKKITSLSQSTELPPCDGAVTQEKKIGLMTKHADCQAALLYDPVHHAVGSVHAGWRGNVKNIYAAAVDKMKLEFKTNPKDLLVCISPSLGPEHAEFVNYEEEFPETFWKFQLKPTYFDLWALAEMQFKECGVLAEHIEIAKICTYTHPDDFYSYRRDKVTGRNGTVIALL